MSDLAAAAKRWGVEPGYHDIFGTWHAVPESTLRKIIAALSRGRDAPADFSAPPLDQRAFQGDGSRVWGLAVQLYAVRSARNWGIGDFGDLRTVVRLAAAAGASAVGLNPLHAQFLDHPEMASPYGPNSRLFLNPLYIAIDEIKEAEAVAPLDEIEAVRGSELVDYTRVAELKVRALRVAHDAFMRNGSDERRTDFQQFRDQHGERLKRFACFEVLRQRYGDIPWWRWDDPWTNPDMQAIEQLCRAEAAECGFVEFMQWIADRQLARCKREATRTGLKIGLYLDLAVGVAPAGADAWSNQASVMSGLSIGAPPDALNPAGQNWGLASFNPHALANSNFAAMRTLLSSAMRHAGAVRLDHVLGLMRLFLIPEGASGDGAYVQFPFEQLLRVVAEESNKYRCVFIGEDLGTVPDGFREIAARWGVWSYRVMTFERRHDGSFKPPSDYPAEALATFNTHDLPSFQGWLTGHDLVTKHGIGIDPGETKEARTQAHGALREALMASTADVAANFTAVAGFLAATPSRLVMVGIEDLLGVVDQVNVPGTVEQHPNWRRKLPVALEEWSRQPLFRDVANTFAQAGRSNAR
jgi:4-alpha-glucanotransferase